ncbi:pantoate/beta-alanine ligase [Pseudopedobacter saltans DSM 12145]|uniref:Pantothenate synthetase n=1 Tax=Pseudopedobacter saltans (strain ATCC 51119 / DSM 12145 / JCM 21818 / CCUG 39354 / LMG 10337 / NBRC 100064 / NCIMB 13643) TaxID=762903 RepID=F0S7V3_PSESL|nr:pantoate--beta-alanine ligase [Pseudopedobacter saltans]ADY53358.1 pantoate/beta-alanine ligase [Pseudopedobacter saltans DSM 12145]
MKILHTKAEIGEEINRLKSKGLSVGLVPTMGALHQGHLSLISQSKQNANITVASIFVNPTQFDNKDDLLNYPKPIEKDIQKLESIGCDVLFNPEASEMYADNEIWNYEVGDLDTKLEGELRPGHYKGVTQIVYKLFDIIKPDIAFFGQKDYQQFLVISKMVKDFDLNIKLQLCEIVREPDGLAMSSRNVRLNEEERHASIILHKALLYIEQNYLNLSLVELKNNAEKFFDGNALLKLEYIRICDKTTLNELNKKQAGGAIVLVACYVGKVRLIDNIIIA